MHVPLVTSYQFVCLRLQLVRVRWILRASVCPRTLCTGEMMIPSVTSAATPAAGSPTTLRHENCGCGGSAPHSHRVQRRVQPRIDSSAGRGFHRSTQVVVGTAAESRISSAIRRVGHTPTRAPPTLSVHKLTSITRAPKTRFVGG